MKQAKVLSFVTLVSLAAALAMGQMTSTSASQALNPEVLGLKTSADLVARDLGFTALGEITFNLVNRGDVGINLSPKVTAQPGQSASSSGPPIEIDLYLEGNRIKTVYQPSMAGKQTRNFKELVPSTLPKPKCLETRNLKVIIDPKNQIKELHDDNNLAEAINAARPCPDLAIQSIKRDKEGVMGETYRPKVTIINKGNAPSPSTQVWGTSLSSLPGITGWPELNPTHTIPALAPGQTTSFKIGGSVASFDNTWVRIILDRFFHIEESDESNNWKDEKL